jgi:putative OPT family oligopeptide transporter
MPQSAADNRRELTISGLLLGGAITLVFTAANVYLGLKVGLTFASSIPAAVISMAILRGFKNSTIYENNIVQTVASAAGTLSAVIFVLPGLVMIGWWTGFPFWQSFGVCVVGGVLGVMYSVPLRRALVTNSDLPYPEGVAAAEILKVGSGSRDTAPTPEALAENKAGLLAVIIGSLVSGGYFLVTATRVFAADVAGYFRSGNAATGLDFGLSLALFGAGHLIGLSVGIAMFVGIFIAWGIATPLLTALHPVAGPAIDVATTVFHNQVRFIGAGAIGVAAIWAILKLVQPVWSGILSSLAASRKLKQDPAALVPRTERDIPILWVTLSSAFVLLPLAVLLFAFLSTGALAAMAIPLVVGAIIYVVLAGFFVAAACGYMAGLIGSSNSPVSGLAILAVIGASLLFVLLEHNVGIAARQTLVAYALFVTAVVLCVATISNDNLQDLKTGQLVDATPWRQQVALVVGVFFGALVIPPILNLLNKAYGFASLTTTHALANVHVLPAPQATLISALAKGVIQGQLNWNLIGIGALVGAAIVAIDEILRATTRFRLPPLAVGLGIYLPSSSTLAAVCGAIVGWAYNRRANATRKPATTKRLGVLLASGFIVGESLCGVLVAGLILMFHSPTPLALVGDAFATPSVILGTIVYIAAIIGSYLWVRRSSQRIAD